MMSRDRVISFYKEQCIYLPAMLGWFFFSRRVGRCNWTILVEENFPCPLLLGSFHFLIQSIFSYLACLAFPVWTGAERIDQMTWAQWASISIPCGKLTASELGLSNVSLTMTPIALYTEVTSSAPIFVLCLAYAFGIERMTWRLVGVIFVIVCGKLLTVWSGGNELVMKHFLLCLGASFFSGARWTLIQSKLQNLNPSMIHTTIATMKLLTPSMFLFTLLMSFAIEQPWNKLPDSPDRILEIVVLGLRGGCWGVLLAFCQFDLIVQGSAMILMICGVIKDMTDILYGVVRFDDPLKNVNLAGILVVFSGVILYKIVFHLDKRDHSEAVYQYVEGDDDNDDDYYNGIGDDEDDETGLKEAIQLV